MPTIVYSIAGGFPPFIVEVVGEAIPIQYRASAGTYTIDLPDCGTYNIRITDAMDCVDEFEAICPCPTTTTTTTLAPTTTTTTYEEYPCGFPISFYGTEFITIYDIYVGADTGWLALEYNIYNIPARIIVEYDEVTIMNTTYRGNASYQAVLNTALTALGLPTEVINTDKESIEYYEKTDAGEYVRIYIYSPIAGATIDFTLKCPVDADFAVTYLSYVCVEEEETTTTTGIPGTTTTTTACTYPAGYVNEALLFTQVRLFPTPYYDFTSSLEDACQALYDFENNGATLGYPYNGIGKNWTAGEYIYDDDACSYIPEGYYIIRIGSVESVIYISPDGIIDSYPDCPTTTTTTGLPMTTTTTLAGTTTTTAEATTTTTTELPSPAVKMFTDTWNTTYGLLNCNPLYYPMSLSFVTPRHFGITCFTPDRTWDEIEYIEIINVVSTDPDMSITYGGNIVSDGMKLYPTSASDWALQLVVTVDSMDCDLKEEEWSIRVKLYGYKISEAVTAIIRWNSVPCCP